MYRSEQSGNLSWQQRGGKVVAQVAEAAHAKSPILNGRFLFRIGATTFYSFVTFSIRLWLERNVLSLTFTNKDSTSSKGLYLILM